MGGRAKYPFRYGKFFPLLLLFLLLTVNSTVRAGEYAADYLDYGVGARFLALGGSGAALCREVESFYWNPAGLSEVQRPEVGFMYGSHYAQLTAPLGRFLYTGAALPISQATLAVNYLLFLVDDIPLYPEYADDVYSVAERAAAIQARGGRPDGWFRDREQALFFSFAKVNRFRLDLGWLYFSIPVEFPLGMNIKILHQNLYDHTATGAGVDFGFKLRLDLRDLLARVNLGKFTLGWSASDFTRTGLKWETKVDAVRPGIRYALAYQLHLDEWEVNLSREVSYKYANVYRLGLELGWRQRFYLRGGLHARRPSFGAGLVFPRYAVDYAFSMDAPGPVHRLSGHWYF